MNTDIQDMLLIFMPFTAGLFCFILGALSVHLAINILGFTSLAIFALYPVSFIAAIVVSYLVYILNMLIVKRYFRINRENG
jgi:uncharacterized membrane protein YvlD (DUF360 family)